MSSTPPRPLNTTTRRLLWLMAVLIAAWTLLAQTVVPSIIRNAYSGDSFPRLNGMITGQDKFPVQKYLRDWQLVYVAGVVYLVLAWAAWWVIRDLTAMLRSPERRRRIVEPVTPGTLGAIRCLVFGIILISALWEDLGSISYLPADMRIPMGVLQWLYALPIGFASFHENYTALVAFDYLTCALAFLAMIGLWSRITIPAAACCYLVFAGMFRENCWFYHTGLIPIYLGLALAFMPCADGWSMDHLIRQRRGKPVPPDDQPQPLYGWCRYILWIILALPYVAAGLSKLYAGGLLWWHPDNMRYILLRDSLNPMHFQFQVSLSMFHWPDWVWVPLAMSAVFGEIIYGLVLPYRRARLILPLMMLSMHIGILFLQNILFFDLILLQCIFWNWSIPRRRLAALLRPDARPAPPPAPAVLAPAPAVARWAAAGVAAFLAACWLLHYEYYPFTAMQMYSQCNTTGQIYYVRAITHYDDGSSQQAEFERWIPAIADSRYRRVLDICVTSPNDMTDQFFQACLEIARKSPLPGSRVTGFEVQQWGWNFINDPDNPTHGNLIRSAFYPPRPNDTHTSIPQPGHTP